MSCTVSNSFIINLLCFFRISHINKRLREISSGLNVEGCWAGRLKLMMLGCESPSLSNPTPSQSAQLSELAVSTLVTDVHEQSGGGFKSPLRGGQKALMPTYCSANK